MLNRTRFIFPLILLAILALAAAGGATAAIQPTSTPLQPVEYEGTITALQSTLDTMQMTLDALSSTTNLPVPTIDPLLLPSVPTTQAALFQAATPAEGGCPRYVVQSGDTVSAIAQRYGVSIDSIFIANSIDDTTILHIDDVLIIPTNGCMTLHTPTPAPTAIPAIPTGTPFNLPPTAASFTPSATPPIVQITISGITGWGNLNTEAVELTNQGDVIDMGGWQLANVRGITFHFPEFRFSPGSTLRIYTRGGASTPAALYWGRASAAWLAGDTLNLLDASGQVRASVIVGQ